MSSADGLFGCHVQPCLRANAGTFPRQSMPQITGGNWTPGEPSWLAAPPRLPCALNPGLRVRGRRPAGAAGVQAG